MWFGRRKADGRRMLRMEVLKEETGMAQMEVYGYGERGHAVVEVTEEDAEDRSKWRRDNPLWQPLMREAKI